MVTSSSPSTTPSASAPIPTPASLSAAALRASAEAARRSAAPYDLFIVALTLISLGLTVLIMLPGVPTHVHDIAFMLDGIISVIFLADFFRALFRAPNKLQYLKWGWMDFLGSLPALPALRWFRILRFIRAWRVLRRTSPAELLWLLRNRPAGSTLLLAILFGIFLLGITSYAILVAEADEPESKIRTAYDAFWWALVSVSTVGYGDLYPTTGQGRVVAVFLMFGGIGLFSVLTGYLATTFTSPRDEEDMDEIRARLDVIERLLREMAADRATSRNSLVHRPVHSAGQAEQEIQP